MSKTFKECYEAFMNSEDRIRRDGYVIREFFWEVDWSLPENQQDFLACRQVLDCLNTRPLTISFWALWGDAGLLKDKNFLIQYLKTADSTNSAVCDPAIVNVFTRNADMNVIIDNLDEFVQEAGAGLIGMIFKYGYPFARVDLSELYAKAAKEPGYSSLF